MSGIKQNILHRKTSTQNISQRLKLSGTRKSEQSTNISEHRKYLYIIDFGNSNLFYSDEHNLKTLGSVSKLKTKS